MRMTIFKNKLITLKIDKDMYKGNLLDIARGSIKLVQTLENLLGTVLRLSTLHLLFLWSSQNFYVIVIEQFYFIHEETDYQGS